MCGGRGHWPPSPKISPRSIGTGSDRSYRSGASSASVTKSPLRTISPRTKSSSHITRPSPPFVRQGTFTKEEGPVSSSNIPIVDIDIGETSSITSNASTSTNNSYARLSSIPVSGPLKHISPGSQASNRRYTAPSRSPRSAGSQSSLDDVQRPARQSTSSSGSSIKIHQTRTSALRERSASKQGLSGRPVGEQRSIGRTTSISSALGPFLTYMLAIHHPIKPRKLAQIRNHHGVRNFLNLNRSLYSIVCRGGLEKRNFHFRY